MSLSINHYTDINLKYNPFSFLNENEQNEIFVPRFDISNLAKKIENSESIFVEFHGKKGHGKSTHLSALVNNYFPNAEYYKLKRKKSYTILPSENIIIIDSFQLLSIKNRLQLLKQQKRLIITAHNSYKVAMLLRMKSSYENVNFNKLDLDFSTLKKIIDSKIDLAGLDIAKKTPVLRNEYLMLLANTHKKDIRSMQEALYQEFLESKSNCYEF